MAGMRKTALEPKRCRLIYSRRDTVGTFVLAEGCKGGGEELKILPPLFIYNDQENYTEKCRKYSTSFPAFRHPAAGDFFRHYSLYYSRSSSSEMHQCIR
jgi:tRNA1(Val) A37 N6-methylase TrmN6